MRIPALLTGLCLGFASLMGTQAATSPPEPAQATIEALQKAHAAVVGIEVEAADGARSADTLGRRREGTGVVIDADGLVLTIGYLTLEAQNIRVVTQDGRAVPARTVAYDLATGFGLLQPIVPLRDVPAAPIGRLQDVPNGTVLMAVTGAHTDGEPSEVGMTQLVSKRAFSGYWEYHIELAAFTSPPVSVGSGNHSGAALFNPRGELVGIGSLLVMDALGNNRRLPGNMFVPVDLLAPVLTELRTQGMTKASRRPWLGLTSTDQAGRVQVLRVNADSPAQQAGLAPGDVVLAVDGRGVASLEAFYKAIWSRSVPDAEIELTVLQGAQTRTIRLRGVDRMQTLARPAGI